MLSQVATAQNLTSLSEGYKETLWESSQEIHLDGSHILYYSS